MSKLRFAFNILAVAVFTLAVSSIAQAQATRTWVSGVGDDANPCSRTAPCKTFAGAISKTAPKGEINVLDPGGFGAVTITKAISIISERFEAGVLVSGTNGIVIAAGANDDIRLEGLDFEGLGTGLAGIKFLSGRHLHVENCELRHFTANAIDFVPNQAGAASVTVNNCRIYQLTAPSVGIRVTISGGGAATAQVNNTRIAFAAFGVDFQQNTVGTVSNSVISNVTNQALVAENTATLNAFNCTLSNNGTGISAFQAGTTIRFANCAIFNNTTGVTVVAGATGDRFGNSAVFGNGTDLNVAGTLNLRTNQ